MPDGAGGAQALVRLMTWLSPAFPVGSFSYSHGLERAVADRLVDGPEALHGWLETLLLRGSGWNDAVLFAASWNAVADGGSACEVAELGEALAGSAERHRETMLQGAAFLSAARQGWPDAALDDLPAGIPYPVAVGALAGAHGVALRDALGAYLQAFVTNLAQAAIRLGVAGQVSALSVLAWLEPVVLDCARRAAGSSLDDLGSAALMSEIVAMRHETQHSRLFRS